MPFEQKNVMSTVLYDSPIYGPVRSRRLGISLGINLMPKDGKCCTFDCIYCECGFNSPHLPRLPRPSRSEVREALDETLAHRSSGNKPLDDISFAGNGEPTSHPHFAQIVSDTLRLRDKYYPHATVSVMSNATFTHKPEVRQALAALDNNIQKLDTASEDYIRLVDRPVSQHYRVGDVVENLKAFHGHVIIQTLFMKGSFDGTDVNNTDERHVAPWLEALKDIAPQRVMIYTIDRETPASGLRKAEPVVLDNIRNKVLALGIPCTVAY